MRNQVVSDNRILSITNPDANFSQPTYGISVEESILSILYENPGFFSSLLPLIKTSATIPFDLTVPNDIVL